MAEIIFAFVSLPMMFAATGPPLSVAPYGNLPPALNYVAVVALLEQIWAAVVGAVKLT
jgi:hypothetical protein